MAKRSLERASRSRDFSPGFFDDSKGKGEVAEDRRGSEEKLCIINLPTFQIDPAEDECLPRRELILQFRKLARCYLARNYVPLSRIYVYLRSGTHIPNDFVLSVTLRLALPPSPSSVSSNYPPSAFLARNEEAE